MAVNRQQVDTSVGRVERVRRTGRTVDTRVDSGIGEVEPSGGLRIADGLLGLVGQGADLYSQNLKKRIELDKVRQTYRAYQGIEMSDDATVAGKRAHDIVTSRDDVLTINDTIMRNVQQNPDMDDDEYDRMSQEAYSGLLTRHQRDPEMMAFLSSEMQRSQPILHKARADARNDYQQVKNQDAFRGSMRTYKDAATTPEDLSQALNGSLNREGISLGVGDEAQRNMLINEAQQDANNGDQRLLQALEMTDWARGDTRLKTARNNFEGWEAQTYAVQIGNEMGNLQEAWEQGAASWAQVQSKVQQINQRFPGTYTAAKVASLKKAGLDRQRENVAVTQAVSASWRPLTDQTAVKLGYQGLDEKTQNKVIAGVQQQIGATADKLVGEGRMTPEQANTWKLQQTVNWSKANQVAVPQLKGILNAAVSTDPSQFNVNEGIPPSMSAALQVFEVMDPGTLSMYGGDKLQSWWLNYNSSKQAEGDASAMARSFKMTYDPVALGQKERADLSKDIQSSVDAQSSGLWGRIGGFLGLNEPTFVSDGEQRRVHDEIYAATEGLVLSGAYDVDKAAEYATNRWLKENTQLSNGSFVRGNVDQIAPIMGVKRDDVDKAFTSYLDANISALQEESGIDDLSIKDVRFEYRPQSHSVVIKDSLGNTISSPMSLEELGASFSERDASERASRASDRGASERRNNQADQAGGVAGLASGIYIPSQD